MGDKFKLLKQIHNYFPKNINTFIEPFVGGGSVFLNTTANKYLLNDNDKNLINLHKFLHEHRYKKNFFFKKVKNTIDKFKLSKSYIKNIVPLNLKKKYPKTYYAHFNKDKYKLLKDYFNKKRNKDYIILYILLIYGFNRILRFNSNNEFNLPVGNVDFNKNTFNALINYFKTIKNKNIKFFKLDYISFLNKIEYQKNDFIYFDPPYLISASEYNKNWHTKDEINIYKYLDFLNNKKINWGLSNVMEYKGRSNHILKKWAKQYKCYPIKSNYISFNDNTVKKFIEVYITNY
jgi:DNA adenine methylase